MKMMPAWKRFWCWKKSKSTIFMEALAQMSDIDIAKITEDALGYRLPQFNQQSEELNASLKWNDRHSEKPKTSSTNINSGDWKRRQSEDEYSEPYGDDQGTFIEMSSIPPWSPGSSNRNAHISCLNQIASKIDLATRNFAVLHNLSNDESHLTLPSVQVPVQATAACGTELLEVVIGGVCSSSTSSVFQIQSQQQQRIARGGLEVQQDAAAVGSSCAPPETARRAVVLLKKKVAALAIKPRERSMNSSLLATSQNSKEARDDQGFERERSPSSIKAALTGAAASYHSQSSTSLHSATFKRPDVALLQNFVSNLSAAPQIHIPHPPPRSRSLTRHTAAVTIDEYASTDGVQQQQSQWRFSSHSTASGGTQELSNAEVDTEIKTVLANEDLIHSSQILMQPSSATNTKDDDLPSPFTKEDMKSHGRSSSAAVEDWGPPPTFTEEDMRLHEAAVAEQRAKKAAARAAKERDQRRL